MNLVDRDVSYAHTGKRAEIRPRRYFRCGLSYDVSLLIMTLESASSLILYNFDQSGGGCDRDNKHMYRRWRRGCR